MLFQKEHLSFDFFLEQTSIDTLPFTISIKIKITQAQLISNY